MSQMTPSEFSDFTKQVGSIVQQPQVSEAMQESVDHAKQELGDMMRSQVSPNKVPYAPLPPATIARKGHSVALFDTGGLRASVESNGSGHIEEVRPDGFTLGTEHEKEGQPIAAYMQSGTSRNGKPHVPARPFIGATESMADQAANAIADQLVSQIFNL